MPYIGPPQPIMASSLSASSSVVVDSIPVSPLLAPAPCVVSSTVPRSPAPGSPGFSSLHRVSSSANIALASPARSGHADSLSYSMTQDAASSATMTTTTHVPFPTAGNSSSSGRKKRVRGVGNQPWHQSPSSDSEDDTSVVSSSPVPTHSMATRPSDAAAGMRISLEGLPRRTFSESQIISGSSPGPSFFFSPTTATLLRKKNGEVVRPSLKSSSSIGSRRSSVSSTPSMEKIVHFDSQLEYVKLFNKEQKPAAVSRDASPRNSDDSDSADELHMQQQHRRQFLRSSSHYPGSSEEERSRQSLVLETMNLPLRDPMKTPNEWMSGVDVKLEKVILSQDAHNVQGTILVRNIAFEKHLAVRFTFDWWQTTSEVSAKYLESVSEYGIDRFEYSFRLPDIAASRFEEKRLFVVIRYAAAGREIWDNNGGENYQMRFKKVTKLDSSRHPPSWPAKSANVDQMADLRKELEKVVHDGQDDDGYGVASWERLTAKLRTRNMHIEEDRDHRALSLKKRYNFESSSKVKWQAPEQIPKYSPPAAVAPVSAPATTSSFKLERNRSPPGQTDMASNYRFPSSSRSRSPRGSPRDTEVEHSPKFFLDPHQSQHQRHNSYPHSPRGRNHQRGGGYFDSWVEDATARGVKFTPTGADLNASRSASVSASSRADSPSPSAISSVASTTKAPHSPTTARTNDSRIVEDSASTSETESCSSSTASSSSQPDGNGFAAPSAGMTFGSMDRASIRFNSFPMDRSQMVMTPAGSSANTPTGLYPPSIATGSAMTPTTLLAPGWSAAFSSPQGSSASFSSTPSFTSASSPSQCPSSPSESMVLDGPPRFAAFGAGLGDAGAANSRMKLESLDYNYFLSRFCYFTGAGSDAGADVSSVQPTMSESGMASPSYASTVAATISTPMSPLSSSSSTYIPDLDEPWVGGEPNVTIAGLEEASGVSSLPLSTSSPSSGQATPTRTTFDLMGMTSMDRSNTAKGLGYGTVTPRAGSPYLPSSVEATPRSGTDGLFRPRTVRGSSF